MLASTLDNNYALVAYKDCVPLDYVDRVVNVRKQWLCEVFIAYSILSTRFIIYFF